MLKKLWSNPLVLLIAFVCIIATSCNQVTGYICYTNHKTGMVACSDVVSSAAAHAAYQCQQIIDCDTCELAPESFDLCEHAISYHKKQTYQDAYVE